MSALKQLTIEHLRGSVVPFSLPFEKSRKLTIVYGENGTGKSTICDAFEFLSRGRVSSLDNRGLGSTSRFWPSLGKSYADVSVTLDMEDGSCRATIARNGDVVALPSESRPRAEVFRKSQILSLIEAKPGERYAAISRFIDVSSIEASEAALRDLIRSLTHDRDLAVARLDENAGTLERFWEAEGRPGENAFAWAEGESTGSTDAFEAEIAALNALQAAYTRLVELPDRLRAAQQTLKAAREAASIAGKAVEERLQSSFKDAAEVIGILRAAGAYLAKNPLPDDCPLCESPERTADLAERIRDRLSAFASLEAAQSKVSAAGLAVQRAEQQLQLVRDAARQDVARFEGYRSELVWPKDVSLPPTPAPNSLAGLMEWLAATATLQAEWKNAEASRHARKQFIGTLKQALRTWQDNLADGKALERLLPRLDRALKIVTEERRRFTDDILAAIAADVARLYEVVHPGEGLNKIRLELDPKKRASLEIGASFCGLNSQPQAYFSDSHLDTLGLCIFLALSALDQPENTILILDDVLASVDQPHGDRLVEMLFSEASRFRHCIITTHYRPWKEKFRWGWLKSGRCQFVELSQWTILDGLTLIRSVPDLQGLKRLLDENPPDPELVCTKAGAILEAVLSFLTTRYECSLPRLAGGEYTVDQLLSAIGRNLRQALRVEVLTGASRKTINLGPFLDELTRIFQVRDLAGRNHNQLSFSMGREGLDFGRQVLQLTSALTDEAGGWPGNGDSGEYWANAGNSRKLYPFTNAP